jgi:bifunctional non-homologous end joining protein LigD
VDHVETDGEALFREAERLGLEGVVGKRADAPYVSGRSRDWRKVRAENAAEFVVVGWTPPGLGMDGGLHLAARRGRTLVYAGRVGSGFEAGVLEACRESLGPLRRATPPCGGAVPRGRGHTWVEPRLGCAVRYTQWTEAGLLRHPVFLRFVTGAARARPRGRPLASALQRPTAGGDRCTTPPPRAATSSRRR